MKKSKRVSDVSTIVSRRLRDLEVLRLDSGEKILMMANKPIIHINGRGRSLYLWIGNDAEGDRACYAHIQSHARIRRFAKTILKRLPVEHRRNGG